MYLFFDTETTGLPKNWKAPVTDVDNWPRLVQLAWIAADADGQELERYESIVKPEGFTVPEASAQIHGITTARARTEGQPVNEVLGSFIAAVEAAQYVVAHNLSYDEAVIGAELVRSGLSHSLWHRERICTKMEATDFCALPGKYGYKWPTLEELHTKLFGGSVPNAHNALADVEATVHCFFELKRLDVI
ncbi:MAG: 3'-5' exonuclease [Bacteroidota bacterium]